MKYRTEWIVALLLALGLVFAAAQWNGSRPQENLPDIQPPVEEQANDPQLPVEDNGPRIPLVGGITKTEDAEGITVEIDLSGDMLVWENALNSGNIDTEWKNVCIKGTYRENFAGNYTWDKEALTVEDIPITIPGQVGMLLSIGDYITRELSLSYHSYDERGKPCSQYIGWLYLSDDFSEFVIWFDSDYFNADESGKYACYPAQTREEAVIIANRVMKQRGFERAIWE